MKRRSFLGAVAGVVLAGAPPLAAAQQAAKVPRIAFLGFNTPEIARPSVDAFRQGLRERGWVDGQNIIVEFRFAGGHVERLPGLVAELIKLGVDTIVAGSSASTRAAKNATKTVPIVMAASADAVGEGFVESLAHPGGNITGMTFLAGSEIAGKQLELLKEVAPSTSKVAVLANPSNGAHAAFVKELAIAAPRLVLQLQVVEAGSSGQLDRAFAAITRDLPPALLVLTDSLFVGQRRRIVNFSATKRLPALYSQREFVDEGGLVSYGPSLSDMARRSALHVDKILKGAVPGDMPVEQPTKFELVINLKTANALGLNVSQTMLLRADEVIQ